MEREVDCQTDSADLSEEITISEKLNSILVAYAKNMILHNPAESSEDEHAIKKKIYEWSREYFQKLYDENGGDANNADDGGSQTESSATRTGGHSVKDQIKKEMERGDGILYDLVFSAGEEVLQLGARQPRKVIYILIVGQIQVDAMVQ
ncbi:hypothetical protein PCYB_113100, partial [Plasmodium cynomolgi strain B]